MSHAPSLQTGPVAPNAYRLLWAGFFAILASGIGFAIRGALIKGWGDQFQFTDVQLGRIMGAGMTGFCFGIVIGGVIADKIGYGKLVIAAFVLHIVSALVCFGAADGTAPAAAYQFLYWGAFIFAAANGTLEAVANPLIATLFPHKRAHYLNILHASWPLGLVLGGFVAVVMGKFPWQVQLGMFLVATVGYGLLFFGQAMPKSEASKQGLSLGEMFKDVGILGGAVVCYLIALFFADTLTPLLTPAKPKAEQVADAGQGADGADAEEVADAEEAADDEEPTAAELAAEADAKEASKKAATTAKYIGYAIGGALLVGIIAITKGAIGSPLLFVLFLAHAMVGSVELGTDGWIQNITGAIFTPTWGSILIIFTSLIMFSLRFGADFIEKKMGLSPVGLLLTCSVIACVGLLLSSRVETLPVAFLALGVYAVGKTFFWPTMLAVASDRFPRTGAVAISIMGGIGMMSAGLIGSPGLGYFKDRYSGEALEKADPELFSQYKAAEQSEFLQFPAATGIDKKKLKEIEDALKAKQAETPDATMANLPEDQQTVVKASVDGARQTLVTDALIPAAMAVIYLLVLLYFKSIGGYKVVHINGRDETAEEGAVHGSFEG
jgi:MFS family permease